MSFSIKSNEQVNLNPPNSSADALNRVMGADPIIAGQLNANGQVIPVNPSGVTFVNGARCQRQLALSTTANVSDPQKFMPAAGTFDVLSLNPNADRQQRQYHGGPGGLVGLVGRRRPTTV